MVGPYSTYDIYRVENSAQVSPYLIKLELLALATMDDVTQIDSILSLDISLQVK
jgi:hypothetical protein